MLDKLTLREIHNQVKDKKLSLKEVVKFCLNNIEEREDEIKSFITIRDRDEILKEAEEKGKNFQDNILYGLPAGVKDVIVTRGVRTTGASKILENYIPPYSATAINKLEKAGYILIGKNNCDEFAMGSSNENSGFYPCRNPLDIERVPGGSSGGSAAAVAAGFVPYSLGTDTGGSVRMPASFCGVVGFKPTYGRVSRYGLMAMGSSLDQIGIIARFVDDVRVVLQEIEGRDEKDATSFDFQDAGKNTTRENLEGVKIGLPKEYFQEGLDERVKDVILQSVNKMKSLGAEIVDISIPTFKYTLPVYYIIMFAEVSSNMSRYDGIRYGKSAVLDKSVEDMIELYKMNRSAFLGKEVKRRIMLGSYVLSKGYFEEYYGRAQKVRAVIKKDFEKVFEKVDYIAGPTTPTPAFKIGEKIDNPLQMYLSDIYTVGVNLAGLPAISVPAGYVQEDGKDLPVGIQLIGKAGDDYSLLSIAEVVEKRISFSNS